MLVHPGDNLLHVFARTPDGHLQQWFYYNGWNHEQFTGDPATANLGTQLHVFAREQDAGLHHS